MKDEYHNHRKKRLSFLLTFLSLVLLLSGITARAQIQPVIDPVIDPVQDVLPAPSPAPVCARTIKANVVALDQVIMYNRLGTVNPGGMIYALKKDVVAIDPLKGIVAKPIWSLPFGLHMQNSQRNIFTLVFLFIRGDFIDS